MITACIICWVVFIALLTFAIFSDVVDAFGYMVGIICGVFCMICCAFTIDCLGQYQPKAMDVYQGKTTLKYEVVDGVKVDSIVVWKDGKEFDK